jgi:hypothetical protein
MSVKYELWASGHLRATYRTLGQSLLGALWRSKKLEVHVYVHKTNGQTSSKCVAAVAADEVFPKF